MSWLKYLNPIEATKKVYDEAKRLPGTWESISNNVVDMSRGDISANPFGKGQSGFDKAAGGDWLSQYPAARTVGRAVGSWFAGGAGGAIGKGAVGVAGALGNAHDAQNAADAIMAGGGTGLNTGGAPGTSGGMPMPTPVGTALRNRNQPLPKMFDPNYRPKSKETTTTVDLASDSESEGY
jgi:hypothetical protein